MKYGIGKKEMRKCYDGKMHECTVLDCAVILKGNTFENRFTIKEDGFKWWEDQKEWIKLVDTEEEIDELVAKYQALGIRGRVQPNFRITDTDTNPIEA